MIDIDVPLSVFILIPVAAAMLFLGYWVYKSNPLSMANKIFFVLTSVIIVGWIAADVAWKLYIVQYAGESFDVGPTHTARYVNELLYYFIAFVGPLFLHLALEMMGVFKGKRRTTMIAVIYAFPVINILLIVASWVTGEHTLFSTMRFEDGQLVSERGWQFLYFHTPYNYGMMVLAYIVLLSGLIKPQYTLQKAQATALILGSLIALVGNVLYVSGFNPTEGTPYAIDPTYLGFVGTLVIYSYAIRRYGLFRIEAVLEETDGSGEELARGVEPGLSYLFIGDEKGQAYSALLSLATEHPGLCVTIDHPWKVRERYSLSKTPIIWLTETTTDERALSPWRLDFEVFYTIKTFMEENRDTVVLIDGVNYLMVSNGREKTLDFMKTVSDTAATSNSTLIVPFDDRNQEEQDHSYFWSIFDEKVRERAGGTSPPRLPSANRLIVANEIGPCFERLAALPPGSRAMCMSTTSPNKLRKRHAFADDILFHWITKLDDKEGALNPRRMEFEGMHAIVEFYTSNKGGTVLLEGLPLLVVENGVIKSLGFVKDVLDIASQNRGSLIVPVQAGTMDDRDLILFEGLFDFKERGSQRLDGPGTGPR